MSKKKKENLDDLPLPEVVVRYKNLSRDIKRATRTQGMYGGINAKNMFKKTMRHSKLADLLIEKGLQIKPTDLHRLPERFWKKMSKEAQKEVEKWWAERKDS